MKWPQEHREAIWSLVPEFEFGMARRRKVAPEHRRILRYEDHRGTMYTVVSDGVHGPKVKLGFQLYCLGDPKPSAVALGDAFLASDAMESYNSITNRWPRLDVHTGFNNVEECIEHHRCEKNFRKETTKAMRRDAISGLSEEDAFTALTAELRGKEVLPHLVSTWCCSERYMFEDSRNLLHYRCYKSWIFVMPDGCLSWQDVRNSGLLHISFDLDLSPLMDTFSEELKAEDNSLLVGDDEGWVHLGRTHYEEKEPVESILLCVRDLDFRNKLRVQKSADFLSNPHLYREKTPGTLRTLSDFIFDTTSGLPCCTYREYNCDTCEGNGFESHERCEIELDEHYVEDDGKCFGCRISKEYRRRSKRIAARGNFISLRELLTSAIDRIIG